MVRNGTHEETFGPVVPLRHCKAPAGVVLLRGPPEERGTCVTICATGADVDDAVLEVAVGTTATAACLPETGPLHASAGAAAEGAVDGELGVDEAERMMAAAFAVEAWLLEATAATGGVYATGERD